MQRKEKERDLMKKAMENINKHKTPECGDHGLDIFSEPANLNMHLDPINPVTRTIEQIRDYITKTDLPSWETDYLRNEINRMMDMPEPKSKTYTKEQLDRLVNTKSEEKCDDEVQIHFHDNTGKTENLKDRPAEYRIPHTPETEQGYNSHHQTDSTDNPMSSYMQELIDRDLEAVHEGLIKAAVENVSLTEGPHTENPLNNPMEQLKQHSMETLEKLSREPKSMYDTSNVRSHNIGESDYSKHRIQPWDIWEEYQLNPWDADIVKRTIRTKREPGKTPEESRIMDYEKIIHVAQERIRQIRTNGHV